MVLVPPDSNNLRAEASNSKKAAILLYMLGEDIACELLKNLNSNEIREVLEHLSKLEKVSQAEVDMIMDEFYKQASSTNAGALNPDKGYANKLMKKVANLVKETDEDFDLSFAFTNEEGLSLLRMTDPELCANFLKTQYPQISALMISRLEPLKAANIIEKMPKKLQSEIITRMANLKEVAPEVLNEIDFILKKELSDLGGNRKNAIGGVKPVAEILNHLPKSIENKILSAVSEKDKDIAQKIKEHMFTFEDLIHVAAKDLQAVLKETDGQKLALALKAASEGLKEKIFSNVSERVKDMIKDDIDTMGPVKLKDVEKAQQDVVLIARKLEEEGKITFGGNAEEEMIV